MKKAIQWLLLAVCMTVFLALAVSCAFGDDGDALLPDDTEDTPATYTIQYSDDTGIKSIEVQEGALYSFTDLPSRVGYQFTGLWSQKTGGTLYVDENGSAVSPFTDKTNLVLYPQFEPLSYTLLLDFGGADPSGNARTMTVRYGEAIPALATNLRLEHKNFVGWFTAPDCGGTQVADAYGLLAERSTLLAGAYDISDAARRIRLYAGFRGEMHTLTLYIDEANGVYEEVQVEHGTPISSVRTEGRVGGKAVLSWSKTKYDTELKNLFTGKVTEDMTLFAAEYAPVIDFDTRGGEALSSLIAKQGYGITLPKPKRDYYQFMCWETASGEEYTASVMPAEGIQLYARWQAKLIFSSNGGTRVPDISLAPGEEVTLPTPTRCGYLFAGWYTERKQPYTSATMPEDSVKLQAGWYAVKRDTTILIAGDKYISSGAVGPTRDSRTELDMSAYVGMTVTLSVHYKAGYGENCNYAGVLIGVYLYSTTTASDAYLITKNMCEQEGRNYVAYAFDVTTEVNSGTFMLCWARSRMVWDGARGNSTHMRFSDVYVDITYPDTSIVLFS